MTSGVTPSQTVYTGASSGVGSAAARLMGKILREGEQFFFCLSSGNKIIMRREIPIERWFMDHLAPFESEGDEWKARFWALIATLEGCVRVIADSVSLLFTAYLPGATTADLELARDKFKAQIQGCSLAFSAMINPRDFKQHVDRSLHSSEPQPILGCRQGHLRWGTPYTPSHVEAT